jgi:hypothetical protein
MKQLTALVFLVSVSLAVAACGGKSSTAKEPTDQVADQVAAEPTPLAPGAWEAMDEDAKKAFMKKTVVPVMAAKFKAFDPEEFAKVDCKTCHGPEAANGKFEMPSGTLPELDFDHPDPDDKAIADFMAKEVKPTMAKLLGMPEYTPDNPKGFGCLHCHTKAE